jgi:hypothetical protein
MGQDLGVFSLMSTTIVNEGVVLSYLSHQGSDIWETLPITETFVFSDGSGVMMSMRLAYDATDAAFFVRNFGSLSSEEYNEQALAFDGARVKVVAIPPARASAASIEAGMSHSEVMHRLGMK